MNEHLDELPKNLHKEQNIPALHKLLLLPPQVHPTSIPESLTIISIYYFPLFGFQYSHAMFKKFIISSHHDIVFHYKIIPTLYPLY